MHEDFLYELAQKADRWAGECVDMETQCLTREGWKFYNALSVDDEILVFDIETETTRWAQLQKIHHYENTSYKVWGNKGFEAAATDNHKWPVRHRIHKGTYSLVETNNWKSQHEFPRAATCACLPKAAEDDEVSDKVRLVAWVAAEGHYRPDTRRGNGVCVSQKVHKEEVTELMARLGVAEGYEDKDGCHRWEITGDLADYVRKSAPGRAPSMDWICCRTIQDLDVFIDTFIKADGCTTPSKGVRKSRDVISQKTGDILDAVLTICTLAGRPVSRASSGKGSNSNVENWTLRRSNMVSTRGLKVLEEREGGVWCPQTPYGTFVARRGKSIFITGNSYDGTSVRAGAKILTRLGYIDRYVWAGGAGDVKNWVLSNSPVVLGTSWTQDMFNVDAEGYVHPTGDAAGGHAYLCTGYSEKRNAFRCMNSWGTGWGQKGKFWIAAADLHALIRNNGEACTATEAEM